MRAAPIHPILMRGGQAMRRAGIVDAFTPLDEPSGLS